MTRAPRMKGQPAGSIRIRSCPSLLPDEAEGETGSDFHGLRHSGNQTRSSQARGQEALKCDLAYSSAICSI